MVDKESFLKLFRTSFWGKLNESIVPFEATPNKEQFLEQLYTSIKDYTYTPSPPRKYITIDKYNGVTRFVPTFDRKDYCVYFSCIKLLEDEIATNRVSGTFGGWRLGNPLRESEQGDLYEISYAPYNSLDKSAWFAQWSSFQNIARSYSATTDYNYFVLFDIANFYDTINLDILEKKIRHVVQKKKQEIVTLLFHFLRNWNKRIEGYNPKTVGLPQDEIGDCSRVLANFYLQDYDLMMKGISENEESQYIRYADDQIIFTRSEEKSRKILVDASRELFKINLNINSGKVQNFISKEDFNNYWAFDIFRLLSNKNDSTSINQGIEQYLTMKETNTKFKSSSVLKRILSLDFRQIDNRFREQLTNEFYCKDFLLSLDLQGLKKVNQFVNNNEEFFCKLDELIHTAMFNSFLYALRNFYSRSRPEFDLQTIDNRIYELDVYTPHMSSTTV